MSTTVAGLPAKLKVLLVSVLIGRTLIALLYGMLGGFAWVLIIGLCAYSAFKLRKEFYAKALGWLLLVKGGVEFLFSIGSLLNAPVLVSLYVGISVLSIYTGWYVLRSNEIRALYGTNPSGTAAA